MKKANCRFESAESVENIEWQLVGGWCEVAGCLRGRDFEKRETSTLTKQSSENRNWERLSVCDSEQSAINIIGTEVS
jgi:hypothetical protein